MKSLGKRSSPSESHSTPSRPFFSKTSGWEAETPPFFKPPASLATPNLQAESAEGAMKEEEEALQPAPLQTQSIASETGVRQPEAEPGAGLQAKLTVGAPNDPFEREADAVADQVVQRMEAGNTGVGSTPLIHAQDFNGPEEEKETLNRQSEDREEEKNLQAKPIDGTAASDFVHLQPETKEEEKPLQAKGASEGEAPSSVRHGLERTKGAGQAMAPPVRESMEEAFGHDFSEVRLHTGDEAQVMNRDLRAQAFTHGHDVYFNESRFDAGSREGRHLLAHELTHVVQQNSLTTPALQRQNAADIAAMDWKDAVNLAEKTAKDPKTRDTAMKYYQDLVVRAARQAAVPAPLKAKTPAPADVVWSWTTTAEYAATTDPTKVDDSPDNYWKWLTFNPNAIQKDEAYTVSAIFHELDHAAHALALFQEWQKSPVKKGKWDDFYEAHYGKWTEKAIKVNKPGMLAFLSGLPKKIQPSAIEFRAYVNQFIHFFHKVQVGQQQILAEAVILFYPLQKQTVQAKISDPGLDLASARQQLLDYFKAPPVKEKTQQSIIRTRVASELKSAMFFRPAEDHQAINAAFKDILDMGPDPDEKREAKNSYKPEPL